MNIMMELRRARSEKVEAMKAMTTAAEVENRDFTPDEQAKWDGLVAETNGLDQRMARAEVIEANESRTQLMTQTRQAPGVLKHGRGDTEARALAAFARTGDAGGFAESMRTGSNQIELHLPLKQESRAVTDSTMNITTAGDGGDLVPTGFVQDIVARKQEMMLAGKLGAQRVPGKGTTVDYPIQNADAQVFATTAEQADNHSVAWERDAPQVTQKAFTLVLKTKKIELTDQLLYDEDAGLMDFLAGIIADGMALTHNAALLTEAAASGTSLKTFAAAATLAAGELEDMVYHATLAYYLDDTGSAAWVMRPPTFGAITKLTGNARVYAETPAGSFNRELLGYPVFYSNSAAAAAASAKSVYFGNWRYMGFREDPTLTLLRDPYTVDGLTILKYSFRLVYGVLQAGALGYGVHPTA